ncbi:MAG: single-stranded DNA-binding protein [Clostridia bacterium]|nr:single-stranded DNA-binding protein [Clostridia bacterium]MDE7256459.1 single-stranded DNA-binding protein [Clostridia bacterium]
MNKVFLIGNLTRDPELTETSGGVSICRFAIAVNRNYSGSDGERKTDFFNVTAWRGLGETVSRYAKKGNKVAVSGSIELRNYEDSTGAKRTAVDIIAQDVEFLTPRNSDGFDAGDAPAPARNGRGSGKPALQSFDDDSDIPF